MRSTPLHVAVLATLLSGEPDIGAAAEASGAGPLLVLAGPREPGARLVVSGRLLDRRGRPVTGESIAIYHTDAAGEYGTRTDADPDFPGPRGGTRLSGRVVTDAAGRFTLRTIRPGAYPGGGTPQHIHFVVRRRNLELLFADDQIVRRSRQGTGESETFQVRPVRKGADGVQHVSIDLRVD